MQINFTPKKIKEAGLYVDRLNPVELPKIKEYPKRKEGSFIKRILQFLFK